MLITESEWRKRFRHDFASAIVSRLPQLMKPEGTRAVGAHISLVDIKALVVGLIVSDRPRSGKSRAKAGKCHWLEAQEVNLPKLESLNYNMCA